MVGYLVKSDIHIEYFDSLQVLDRLCLIAFTILTVILSGAVLIAAPHVVVV